MKKEIHMKDEKLESLLKEHSELMKELKRLSDHAKDVEEKLTACEKERDDVYTENSLIKAEVSIHVPKAPCLMHSCVLHSMHELKALVDRTEQLGMNAC